MKRVFCLLLAVFLVCSLSACAGQSEEEERIVRVVTRMLTCPDEELTALIEGSKMIYDAGDPVPNPEKLADQRRAHEDYAEYLKTVFTAEDLTEEFQTRFCGEGYLSTIFPTVCVDMEAVLSVESVTVEVQSEDSRTYGYTAELVIEKDGTKTPFTQIGKVQLSEDGRISWIDTYGFNELTEKIAR